MSFFNDDEELELTPEEKHEIAEGVVFGALVSRCDLDIAWASKSEGECSRNRRRYAAAKARNANFGRLI